MRFFSLFSGIGGFDLAAQRLGHEIVGACEIDKFARSIYARQFPKVKVHTDVTKINPRTIPRYDCTVAGFPCPSFSMAGKRLGFKDPRGELFFEIIRIVRQTKSRLLLLENVKGLFSHDKGRTFRTMLSTLDQCGYDAQWQMLNSKYWVPQNRERVFIICNLREKPRPKVFPYRENHEVIRETRKETQRKREWVPAQIAGAIDANYSKGGGARTLVASEIDQIKSLGSIPIPFTRRKHEPIQKQIAEYLKLHRKINITELSEITTIKKTTLEHYFRTDMSGALPNKKDWLILKKHMCFDATYDQIMTEYVQDHMTHEMQTRVHDIDGICPTLTGDSKLVAVPVLTPDRLNKRQHCRRFKTNGESAFTLTVQDRHGIFDGKSIRKLTPLECERLQGFPDSWTRYGKDGEEISDTQRYKCLGNAVTVPVVESIISRME